jgi:hypothetical protein
MSYLWCFLAVARGLRIAENSVMAKFAEHSCFSARSNGNIGDIVLLGKEDKTMYWYNPTTRASERVEAPSTDEQAIQMLAGTHDSAELIKRYLELRRSRRPIEQALVLVRHEFRLRQPQYRQALR